MTAKTELEKLIIENEWDAEEEQPYYYYDNEENYRRLRLERGDMPDDIHNELVFYLIQVLRWYYHTQKYTVQREFNFYQTDVHKEEPLYPDVFLIKQTKKLGKSYRVGKDGPAPEIIIEIMSSNTRQNDIGSRPTDKPQRYEAWGVSEYFVYDPRARQRKLNGPRLWGWRLVEGKYQSIEAVVPDGRMWSEQLESWLVPDGELLRLQDKDGNLRLTEAEAATQLADTEKRRADLLAQKLRELGVDPDSIA